MTGKKYGMDALPFIIFSYSVNYIQLRETCLYVITIVKDQLMGKNILSDCIERLDLIELALLLITTTTKIQSNSIRSVS